LDNSFFCFFAKIINLHQFSNPNNKNEVYRKGADYYNGIWAYSEVGDSIFKQQGTFEIMIKKRNGEGKYFFYEKETPRESYSSLRYFLFFAFLY
jgi:hypothetical protein